MSIATDKKAYLNSLKRVFNELSYQEQIITHFYYNFIVLGIANNDVLIMRYCGAAEAILTIEGYLKPYQEFEYLDIEKKFWGWRYTKKETYKDFLLRISTQYLIDKGIL